VVRRPHRRVSNGASSRKIHLAKRRQSVVEGDLDELVEQAGDYSPAEIEAGRQDRLCGSRLPGAPRPGGQDLFDAVKRVTPLSKSRRRTRKMREEARRTGALFANAPETGFGPLGASWTSADPSLTAVGSRSRNP